MTIEGTGGSDRRAVLPRLRRVGGAVKQVLQMPLPEGTVGDLAFRKAGRENLHPLLKVVLWFGGGSLLTGGSMVAIAKAIEMFGK